MTGEPADQHTKRTGPRIAAKADIIVAQATQQIVFDLLAEQMREKAAAARRQFT